MSNILAREIVNKLFKDLSCRRGLDLLELVDEDIYVEIHEDWVEIVESVLTENSS